MGPAEVMNNAILKGSKMRMVTGGAVTVVPQFMVATTWTRPTPASLFPAFAQDMKGKKIGVTACAARPPRPGPSGC